MDNILVKIVPTVSFQKIAFPLTSLVSDHRNLFLYPLSPMGEGGILFYLCPSVRPSKIFFVAFFSVTVNGRNLIFGHKHHIGGPVRFLLPVCRLSWFLYTLNIYAHFSSHFSQQLLMTEI